MPYFCHSVTGASLLISGLAVIFIIIRDTLYCDLKYNVENIITIHKNFNDTLAAIDLGSNSFHMVVANKHGNKIVIVDRIREMVRLAAGLDDNGHLSKEAEEKALLCLQRFRKRLQGFSSKNVSVVGTNTLRLIRNPERFLRMAQNTLGHAINVITGTEEARLIYQGVAHSTETDSKTNLVIDIGGGSTEMIIGKNYHIKTMQSLEMGCVTMTRYYFSDRVITSQRINQARDKVIENLKIYRHSFCSNNWDMAIGASGTIKSTLNIIREMNLDHTQEITADALAQLIYKIKEFETIDSMYLDGLSERRKDVFLGGVIILYGVFEALDITRMSISDGALREGLLYDMQVMK